MSEPFLINFLGGVLSSLVAVVFVESYLLARTRLRNQRLRNVLSFSTKRCFVVTPAFLLKLPGAGSDQRDESGLVALVGDRDVYAVSRALELCRRVGSTPELISAKDPFQTPNSDLFCIGSWSGNDYTDSLLRTYCPGFVIHQRELESTDFDEISYQCGDNVFKDSTDTAYGFLIKLAPELTGMSGTILMAWGHHAVGNGAVMELLAAAPGTFAPWAKKSFVVAIVINRRIGIRGASRHVTDLTEHAFEAPKPS